MFIKLSILTSKVNHSSSKGSVMLVKILSLCIAIVYYMVGVYVLLTSGVVGIIGEYMKIHICLYSYYIYLVIQRCLLDKCCKYLNVYPNITIKGGIVHIHTDGLRFDNTQ